MLQMSAGQLFDEVFLRRRDADWWVAEQFDDNVNDWRFTESVYAVLAAFSEWTPAQASGGGFALELIADRPSRWQIARC